MKRFGTILFSLLLFSHIYGQKRDPRAVGLVGATTTIAEGIYAVGYQFGAIIGIFAMAFNNAYAPYLYEQLSNITNEKKIKLVKFTYLYFIGILFFAIFLSYVFSLIIPYFLGESFHEASKFIIWIALAHAFQGMYLMVVNYIYYTKKTYVISIVTFSMSIIHVALSYSLIHIYGVIGAAYATIISFFITFIWVWIASNKVYSMPWKLNV